MEKNAYRSHPRHPKQKGDRYGPGKRGNIAGITSTPQDNGPKKENQ